MRPYLALGFSLLLTSCSSVKVAKDLKFASFEEITMGKAQDAGPVEGKDCQWSVLGYELGDSPSVRYAVEDTKARGLELKALKNITVENSGFSAWIVGRRCVVVSALGVK